jgi:hypothetical protein
MYFLKTLRGRKQHRITSFYLNNKERLQSESKRAKAELKLCMIIKTECRETFAQIIRRAEKLSGVKNSRENFTSKAK